MSATFRILDANFNRSREALRVMEEYARFVLNDASLSADIKAARHDLAAAIKSLSGAHMGGGHGPPHSAPDVTKGISPGDRGKHGELSLYRDTVGDVGTAISTVSEGKRADAADVAVAACKRLTEALRVLEEYGKVIDAAFAAGIEQLRYRSYELERRVHATVCARQKFGEVRLYVLITESLCRGDWLETAQAALAGGADCLQLREKSLTDHELFERAKRLAQLCRDMQKIFIVNDRPDVALAAGAHGVHVGQDDLPVAAVRRMLPANMIVGLSTHTIEQIEAAIVQAPDYIAVGPMFDSPTKPQPHVAGTDLLAKARGRTALPLTAIGGIDERNIADVLAAGGASICVCRAVIADVDPAAAARRLRGAVTDFEQRLPGGAQ